MERFPKCFNSKCEWNMGMKHTRFDYLNNTCYNNSDSTIFKDCREIIKEENNMTVYTQNENFTVWMDTSYLYYLQMAGGEIEPKAYDLAAEAMEAFYER